MWECRYFYATWTPSTVLPGDGRFHIITLEQGVSLSIEDGLVLEFCEGGALVIESGAYASLDGTLTSNGDMTWQGVFVEGDTSQGQHINLGNGGFHGLQQGLIHTREGSMIKNAKIGIRNYGLDGDASTGGMIRCEETSFINNTIGVDFGPYQNYSTDGIPKSSLGTFRNCTFNTDTTYHLHEPFNAFVKMRKADGMRFAGCSFTNYHPRFQNLDLASILLALGLWYMLVTLPLRLLYVLIHVWWATQPLLKVLAMESMS